MKNKYEPLVSIGMPVFNGEATLKDSISSILNQTYKNIELIKSDNGSTDLTNKICLSFSERDSRIIFVQSTKNMGAIYNSKRVFDMASGKYFMWAAHDDMREPDFIYQCVIEMENNEDAVLCQGLTEVSIEGSDKILCINSLKSFESKNSLVERYKETLYRFPATAIYGLYKRDAILKTGLFDNIIATDMAFIQELSIQGKFIQVNKIIFKYIGRRKWNTIDQDYYAFTGRKNKPWWYLPFLILILSHFKRLAKSQISINNKFKLSAILFAYVFSYIAIKLVNYLVAVLFGNKNKISIGKFIYQKYMHNPNTTVKDELLYLERVIKPMLHFKQ